MIDKYKEELKKPVVKYGLIAVGVLFLMQIVLVPWFEWRAEVANEWHSKAALTISDEDLNAAIDNIKAQTLLLEQDLAKLSRVYQSQGNNQVVLPGRIRELSQAFDVTIEQVSVSELEKPNRTLSAFAVSVEASGSVDAMFRFIRELEQDKSLFNVERLTVYSRRNQQMKVRMELRKYVEQG